jgi:hypothetical protein
MVRLRNALLIVAMAAGAFGCAHGDGSHRSWLDYEHWSIFHCSQCDDFPQPGYGPHGSLMPGTYSGMPPASTTSSRMSTPTSSNAPPPNYEAVVNPPDERPATPTGEPGGETATPPAVPPANP